MSLLDHFAHVKRYLSAAKELVILDAENNQNFFSWLELCEFELAWDCLLQAHKVEYAYEKEFFLRMLQAATAMGLDAKAESLITKLLKGKS